MLTDAQLAAWKKLTKRQRECVEALRDGHCTNKHIARALHLAMGQEKHASTIVDRRCRGEPTRAKWSRSQVPVEPVRKRNPVA